MESASAIDSLEMVQRRSARRICHDFSPTTALVNRLGLVTLETRRANNKAIMMYKVMNGLVELTPRPGVICPTTRNTRGQENKLIVPYSRTDVMKHSFFPSAIRIWNGLPPSAPTATTIDGFRAIIERRP